MYVILCIYVLYSVVHIKFETCNHKWLFLFSLRLQAFRRGCSKDLKTYCPHIKRKSEAVTCLSQHIRNNTLLDKPIPLSRHCQQQVRFENFARSQVSEQRSLYFRGGGVIRSIKCAKSGQGIWCYRRYYGSILRLKSTNG